MHSRRRLASGGPALILLAFVTAAAVLRCLSGTCALVAGGCLPGPALAACFSRGATCRCGALAAMSAQNAATPPVQGSSRAASGMNVRVAFALLHEDGTVVDARDAQNPLEFVCGEGLVFPGLAKAVQGLAVGEAREVRLQGDEAFGAREEERKMEVDAAQLPPDIKVGSQLKIRGPDGEDIFVTVAQLQNGKAVLDLNHPLAGAVLNLSVKLLSCEIAPELAPFEVEAVAPGDGKTYPSKGNFVTMHYRGALAEGNVGFMSTREKGEPIRFQLGVGQVIKGLDEGIPLMSLGERAVLRIPAVMAYGAAGKDDVVPPNADLIYEVQLLKIE